MSTRLKILVTSGIFPPDIGGPASYVPKISEAFIKKGHQIDVICLTEDDHSDDHENYPFKVHRINRSIFIPWRILKTIIKIYSLSKKSDIVFANNLSFESSIGAWIAGTPIVHKIVGDYAWEMARNNGWYKGTIDEYQTASKNFKLKALDFYFKFGYKFANVLFTPSNYLSKIVKAWNINNNVKTIYNSVKNPELQYSLSNFDQEYIHLITVCRLVPWKHVDEIIITIKKYKRVKLHIVGDGPLRKELEGLSNSLQLKERISFYGQINNITTLGLIQDSDAFVLNSTYEGLPHVVLEAMACGVPVICNNVGGCPEVIKHLSTGFLMEREHNDKNLSSAIELLMSNRSLYVEMRKNALNMVRTKFDFVNMVSETEDLLINILKD